MIEFGLIFAAGFLSALLLALLLAPFFWNRAVTLTGKRIAASVPTTVAEARAEKDQIRADYAMRMRKLEIGMARARDKVALTEASIGRIREENRQIVRDNGQHTETIETLESEICERNQAVAVRDQSIEEMKGKIAVLEKRLAKSESSLKKSQQSLEKLEAERDDLRSDLDVDRVRVEAGRRERERLAERLALQDGELQSLLDRLSTGTRELNRERERRSALEERLEALGETVDRYEPVAESDAAVPATDPKPLPLEAEKSVEPEESDATAYASALRAENELLRSQLDQLRSMNGSGGTEQMDALREALDRFAEETVAAAAAKEGEGGAIHQLLADEQDSAGLSGRFAARLSGER
ncbi:hypothetical protein [Notoacmeibacter sp. MSK16QG-6]|uniref:hypothetical protein n=1 Tax=Notoacmeibacter sp. MSK16QG-6 TaxID=2957982 RepID=UPI0020A01736|nr:hypothetical protein [Notoacmeibacter sp. MSK16QG-6]MCP1199917.1 hypothetical protein [Notoacmeibacter sp. MSK16QG-6]